LTAARLDCNARFDVSSPVIIIIIIIIIIKQEQENVLWNAVSVPLLQFVQLSRY